MCTKISIQSQNELTFEFIDYERVSPLDYKGIFIKDNTIIYY